MTLARKLYQGPLLETKNDSKERLPKAFSKICKHVQNQQANQHLKSDPGPRTVSHLIELYNVGGVLLLINLLLSLKQRVLAVCTAADPVVILFIQDGAYTAHAADTAPAGAMDTIR